MSSERHPDRYKPAHRSRRGNKARRGKRGNAGSKFDHYHDRITRLKLRWKVDRSRRDEEDAA